MNRIGPAWSAVGAVFKRDLVIFASYRFRLVSQGLALMVSLTTFYFIARLVHVSAFSSPKEYYAFVVYGIVIMAILTSALNMPDLFRSELVAGTFERTLVSPVGPVAGILAMVAFPAVFETIFAALMLIIATALYGLPVHVSGLPLAIPIAILGTTAFTAIGILFVATVMVFKSVPGHAFISAGIGIFGGAFFPVRLLPHWLQWVPYAQPFTPAVDLLRHELLGTTTIYRPSAEGLVLLAWAVVLLPLSVFVLDSAVSVGRRRGILLEY